MTNQIEKKYVCVNGTSILCYCAGEGEYTIVLLHGAGVDSAMLSWGEVIPMLSRSYKVIAPDLPGYGESDCIDGEYTLSFYTDIVKGIIETFEKESVILVGLSLGGGIGLNMALIYPELIKILVLVDAWGLFDKLSWHRLTHWFVNSKLNENLYAYTNQYPFILRFSLRYSLFGDKSKVSDNLIDEIQKAMLEPGAGEAFASFQRSEITPTGFTTDLFGRLEEIKLPTLLIHGTLDKAVPVKGALLAKKKIEDSEIYLMEGCKHWPQKERPEEFTNALQLYLDRKL